MKFKTILAVIFSLAILTGCTFPFGNKETNSVTETEITEISEEVTEAEPAEPVHEITDSDKKIADFFKKDIADEKVFTDKLNYQYYAKALGQDRDIFLDPAMWEVFYSEQINLNKEINEKEIYLIRLNPYKLLDIYAENNGVTVDELCEQLHIKKEQLYYNWGYNPASDDYFDDHKDGKVSYSEKEKSIFGDYNNEDRTAVMRTHMLTVEKGSKFAEYSSTVSEFLKIKRRDILSITSKESIYYSQFTENEKNAAFKVNNIGIRAIIPLAIPNAYKATKEMDDSDKGVTVMLNMSPFAYGCTDADKIDITAVLEILDSEKK